MTKEEIIKILEMSEDEKTAMIIELIISRERSIAHEEGVDSALYADEIKRGYIGGMGG